MSFGRTNDKDSYFDLGKGFSNYWLEICIPRDEIRVRQEIKAQLNILRPIINGRVIISDKNGHITISLDHLNNQDTDDALNKMAEKCQTIQTTLTNRFVATPSKEITDRFLSSHIKFCQKPVADENPHENLKHYNEHFNKFSTAVKNIKNPPLDRRVLLKQKQLLMNILYNYQVKLQQIETRLSKNYGENDNKLKIIREKIALVKKEQDIQGNLDWQIYHADISDQALKKAVVDARKNISDLISLDLEREPRLHELFTHSRYAEPPPTSSCACF